MRRPFISLLVAFGLAAAACAGTSDAAPIQTAPRATTPTVAAAPSTEAAATATVLELQYESVVRFVIFQYFRGTPNYVEGVNPRVRGEVVVDGDAISIGTVTVRAETFKTEKNKTPNPLGDEVGWRDEAIDRYILEVEDHPEITFEPIGNPELVADGDYRALDGELTIRGITQPVTFFVAISKTGEDVYSVNGFANVLRGDFGLTLPTVRHVTEVAEEVSLEFDFIYGPKTAET